MLVHFKSLKYYKPPEVDWTCLVQHFWNLYVFNFLSFTDPKQLFCCVITKDPSQDYPSTRLETMSSLHPLTSTGHSPTFAPEPSSPRFQIPPEWASPPHSSIPTVSSSALELKILSSKSGILKNRATLPTSRDTPDPSQPSHSLRMVITWPPLQMMLASSYGI